MTTVGPRFARPDDLAVVRVGRLPDPLAFVPLAVHTWAGRFDDPHRLWRTLYAAEDEYGAWVEVLGRFRGHTGTSELAAAVEPEATDREPAPAGTVALSWIGERGVARAEVRARVVDLGSDVTLRWLDLRAPLRGLLMERGIRDLDLSMVAGPDRRVTQAVAREFRASADADVLRYPSRYGGPSVCFAIFEPIDGLPDIRPSGA